MKKKILIIEDEPSLRNVLFDKFSKENFDVLVANNGQEGLDKALLFHPECILLDIIMPVMDGISMLSKLREDPWGKTVEVLMLTNLSNPEIEATSVLKGVKDYLIKTDWKLDDVVQKVKNKIGESI